MVAGHIHYRNGGAEVQTIRIARELLRRGYEVCYLNNPLNDKGTFPETEVIDGIRLYNYKCHTRFRLLDYFQIKALVNRINADVYYFRACKYNEGFITFLTKGQEPRTIWQCAAGRSMTKFWKTRQLFSTKRWLAILVNAVNALCYDYLHMYTIRNADSLICQNQRSKQVFLDRFHREGSVILKGIRVENLKTDKSESTLNVLFLRTIRSYSRYETFLEVAGRFKDSQQINFITAGRLHDGNSRKSRIVDSMRDNGVEYLGPLENEKALELLDSTHLLIDTLVEPEGQTSYNTSFLEAWSKGVAILAFGSNPDNIFGRENVGFFVHSVDECVERIAYLAEHRDVLQKIGSDARDYVLREHSIEREVDQLVAHF